MLRQIELPQTFLEKAVEKYSRFHKDVVSSSDYFESVPHDFDLDSDSDEPSEKTPEFPPIPSNSNSNNNSVENQTLTNFVQSSTTLPLPNQEQGEHRIAW